MNCKQCGKEIPKTNQFNINYNEEKIVVCGKHYAQYLKYNHFLDNNQKTCFDKSSKTSSKLSIASFSPNSPIASSKQIASGFASFS